MATLNGTTLPTHQKNPKVTDIFDGRQDTSHNGTVLTDYGSLSRLKFKLEFKGITAAQYTTLWGLYGSTASQTYITPDGDTYTVVVTRGSWRHTAYKYGATEYYDAEFDVEEAS